MPSAPGWRARSVDHRPAAATVVRSFSVMRWYAAVAGAHDVADLAAVLEEAAHRVPEVEARHRLRAEGCAVNAAHDVSLVGSFERPALGDADERRRARADALDRRAGRELVDVDAGIGNLNGHRFLLDRRRVGLDQNTTS